MITYQTENLDTFLSDAKPMLYLHYEEIAWRKDKIPLAPDYETYYRLEKSGVLRIYTAREDGKLVGYALFMVSPNPHYQTVTMAKNDLFYVTPDRRGVMTGQRLIRYAETELKTLGVNVISLHIKTAHDWRKLAEHWGYETTEVLAQKWIGD